MSDDIKRAPLVRTPDGYWRRVDHAAGLASTGFATRDAMRRYSGELRTDPAALELMRARYREMFPAGQ